MAVAHDGEANVTTAFGAGTTTATFVGKTTAGSDRAGILAFAITQSSFITAVTWNGVAMSQLATVDNPTDGRTSRIYWIANPPTAASDVVVTASSGVSLVGTVSSYSGAHQTTQDATAATASGTASPATVDASSATGEMVVDSLYFLGAGTAPAVGAGQTENGNLDQGTWFNASSREAGAATVTMSWTLTSSTRWSIAGVSIRAAAAGGDVLSAQACF